MRLLPSMPGSARELMIASSNPAVWQYFAGSSDGTVAERAAGGADALAKLEGGQWRWLLLDHRLPDLNAEEVAQIVRRRFPQVGILMFREPTPGGGKSVPAANAVAGIRVVSSAHSAEEHRFPEPLVPIRAKPLPGMIGESEAMLHVYRMARLVAGRNTTVLVTGETGTGKEVVARGIHQLSPRSNRPLVVVNCAAIPESLLESELFGHTRGAFTGAVQSQAGRFQAAHGGTLFLDEVGELPLSLQPKLLRFLESKEVQRLGSPEPVRIDVRVIAATNVDLERRVEERQFREDLFYRLSGFRIELPPLRHRTADIIGLARQFIRQLSTSTQAPHPQLSAAAARALESHAWKGNVRELQLVLEQACILADGAPQIEPEHLRFATIRQFRHAAAV